jgi:hypothetical protein
VTYRDVDELFTPDDVVFIGGGRSVGNRLHVLEESDFGLVEESSHIDRVRLWMMGVVGRDVMCNAATA